MEELNQVNVKFEYTDMFKQQTKFEQTLNIDSDEDDIYILWYKNLNCFYQQ